MNVERARSARNGSSLKRGFDLICWLAIAPFAILVTPFLIILIRMDSKGPALFRQKRVGLRQREFVLLKFRTMKIETQNVPSHEASISQVTKIGHFLRRTKLDEVPQLWNVLTGSMSFVGPRPCLPSQTELIVARRELGVFEVLPGITGLAQCLAIDMSEPALLARMDAQYCRDWSFTGDIKLLWMTLTGKGQGDRIAHSPRGSSENVPPPRDQQ